MSTISLTVLDLNMDQLLDIVGRGYIVIGDNSPSTIEYFDKEEARMEIKRRSIETLSACEMCYTHFGPIIHNWAGRGIMGIGVKILISLRYAISINKLKSEQEVQDDYCHRYLNDRNLASLLRDFETNQKLGYELLNAQNRKVLSEEEKRKHISAKGVNIRLTDGKTIVRADLSSTNGEYATLYYGGLLVEVSWEALYRCFDTDKPVIL